jgi:DNA-binding MarR family transcriptional regulator
MRTIRASIEECADQILTTVPTIVRGLWNRWQADTSRTVTWSQFGLLSLLHEHPAILTQLAAEWGVTKASMSKMVNMLMERGWIASKKDPADRRRKPLHLTPAGRKAYARVYDTVRQNLIRSLSNLDDDQQTQIVSALDLLVKILT